MTSPWSEVRARMLAERIDPEATERTIESLKRGMAEACRGEVSRRDDFLEDN